MTIDVQKTLSSVRSTHRTTKYKTNALVVRRGFSVSIATTSDTLSLTLIPVRSSRRLSGSYSIKLSTSSSSGGWTLTREDSDTVSLFIPVSAKVGLYRLKDSNSAVALVVLFNPYSSDDSVYMPGGRRDVREYVQAEAGRIWRGSSRSNSGMPWSYSQFRLRVLLSALDLLDRIPVSDRHDAVQVCRKMSALINSSDRDSGVVVGNWSGEYDNGTSPSAWTGSAEILTKYWDNGSRPVRYGQCWVFAGVFTTVLRSLGVPCMPISNFASAHESKPYNRVIEHYYDADGNRLEDRTRGSTWNFHVWNMVYMRRPDLAKAMEDHGQDYNGWQVVDGTPQETSQGTYQLGPTPVRAIKYGYEVDFDADFVIGEVNCDRAYFRPTGSGSRTRYVEFSRDTSSVGQKLSVKTVGRDYRQDVTDWYKFDEGSRAERDAFRNREKGKSEPVNSGVAAIASRALSLFSAMRGRRADTGEAYETVSGKDYLSFEVDAPEKAVVGDEVVYVVKLKPGALAEELKDEGKTVHVNVLVEGTDYTGASVGKIRTETRDFTGSELLADDDGMAIDITVSAEDYESLLAKGMQTINFDAAILVHSGADTTDEADDDIIQSWANATLVLIDVDPILTARFGDDVTVEDDDDGRPVAKVSKGDEFIVIATLKNVAHVPLTGATLRVEGEGVLKEVHVEDVGTLDVDEEKEVEVTCKAMQPGDRLIVMTLDTKEIVDVARSVHVVVKDEAVEADEEDEAEDMEDDADHGWEGDEVEAVDDLVEV